MPALPRRLGARYPRSSLHQRFFATMIDRTRCPHMAITRIRPWFQGVRIITLVFGAAVLFLQTSDGPTLAQQARPETGTVTYAKDIAPIFQRSCQQCHRPGASGPMSLVNYDEVRPWARSIKQKVVLGEMPPYR